jgi:hypothetical protein
MNINEINSLLSKFDTNPNVTNIDSETAQIYKDLTRQIFSRQHYIVHKYNKAGYQRDNIDVKRLDVRRLEAKDVPLIRIVRDIVIILSPKKINKIGPHEELTNKIASLEQLKSNRIQNDPLNSYCSALIDGCISSLKEKEKGVLEKKLPTKLSDEQYSNLREQGKQLDTFFSDFDKYLAISKEKKNPHKEFARVWTLTINKCFIPTSKKMRAASIGSLEKSVPNLPEGLGTETSNIVKANLNFMLAVSILANEMNRSSPNVNEIQRAKELLKASKEFSIPASIIAKYDFNEWKNLSVSSKDMKKGYKEMLKAIDDAGCAEFVSKKDLKDVFKMTSREAVKKDKAIHNLKTAAAVLSLPIVWTATVATCAVGLAAAVITWPYWYKEHN